MASLEKRGQTYRIVFRYAGQRFARSLRTRSEQAANASLARLEDNLRRLELGTLLPPDDADLASFLLSDGHRTSKAKRLNRRVTVGQLLDGFLGSIPERSLEKGTLDCMRIHVRNLKRVIGANTLANNVQCTYLQQYVDKRSNDKGHRGKPLSPSTIKMEIGTFSAAWAWGADSRLVSKPFPRNGLRFPKATEKPPFQTWKEIERKISRGGLSEPEEAELWECLFLTLPEIEELLGYVKSAARQPFFYPMVAFAAHTGARRSEMMRSEVDDIDLDGQTALIHEKKRVRGKLSTRRVPLSPFLLMVIRKWLENHPGGKYTFCLDCKLPRGDKTREIGTPLTRDETHDHFKRTLTGSKWEKIRGWHIFRHSFCSNCAAKGIDQRIINAWVGHQTEEMVRRYRHLIPNQQQEAIRLVFSDRE